MSADNRIHFAGLDALFEFLRTAPERITDKAADIIENTTELTRSSLVQSYPRGRTGNLRAGVQVEYQHTRFGVLGRVVSKSPHAHLWEFGTVNRKTALDWKRGAAPHHKPQGLVPIAERNRKQMIADIVDVLRAEGFEVTVGF